MRARIKDFPTTLVKPHKLKRLVNVAGGQFNAISKPMKKVFPHECTQGTCHFLLWPFLFLTDYSIQIHETMG